jgi:hypothetical protein
MVQMFRPIGGLITYGRQDRGRPLIVLGRLQLGMNLADTRGRDASELRDLCQGKVPDSAQQVHHHPEGPSTERCSSSSAATP